MAEEEKENKKNETFNIDDIEINVKKNNGDLGKNSISKSKRSLYDNGIFLTSEFESGNGINFKKYDEGIYGFNPIRDPGKFYSGQAFYFKFLVENRLIRQDSSKEITVTAIADYDDIWKGWSTTLNVKIWKYSVDGGFIEQLDSKRVKPTPKSIGINLKVAPQEKFYISNTLSLPYSRLRSMVENVQIIYPNFTKLTEVARSPLNNQIYSLKINPEYDHWNDKDKLKILISGTPQPNEIGDFGAYLLLQSFLNKGADFWDEFHKYFKLEFLFFQNPDGNIEGRNMVNSKGQNIFFGYKEDEEKRPDECKKIWDYISKEPPNFFLEIHSFFQDSKTIRPYIYPKELFKNLEVQKTYVKLSKDIISFSNGAREIISLDQDYFKDTLAYRLQQKFDTMAIQYKLHSYMKLEENQKTIWEIYDKSIKNIKKSIKKKQKRDYI